MISLRARLGLGLSVSLLIVFALQWFVVAFAIRSVAESYVRSRLEHDAESLLAALNFDHAGRPRLDPARLDAIYQRPFSGHYFALTAGGAILRSRSLWDEDLALPPLAAGGAQAARVPGPLRQTLIQLTHTFIKQDRSVTIAVAEDVSALDADIARFTVRYAIVSAVALLLLLALQVAIVYGGLRPVDRVRADVRRLEHGEIEALGEDVPKELRPLVQEFNRLLAVMAARLHRSRQALGNLAHALKTPLTLLKDVIDRDVSDAPVRARLAAPADSIHRLIDRELKLARLAGVAPGQHVDIGAVVPSLIEAMKTLHRDKHLSFELASPSRARVALDREDLLEMLGNVVDNACRYARSRVRVSVAAGGRLRLLIEDDGPGVAEDKIALLARRGMRLDEGTRGHGLGLAIAADIAASYGGELRFERSSLGGLAVTIDLPLQPLA